MSGAVPLPEVNSDTAPWWEATRLRQLVMQHCRSCGYLQHYPRPLCLRCRGTDLEFTPVSGPGRIHTFTVVHRSPDPVAHPPPYVVALVRLDEGPTVFTAIVDCAVEEVTCEQPVTVGWRPLGDGRHLPVFSPVA